MIGSVDIYTVPAGTVIECNGEKLAVTDSEMVHKGGKVYMTQPVFDRLKALSDKGELK